MTNTEEITVISATDARRKAKDFLASKEVKPVFQAILEQAESGCFVLIYGGPLSEAAINLLEHYGYRVERNFPQEGDTRILWDR